MLIAKRHGWIGIWNIPYPHPADYDSPAVRRYKGLRSVEIESHIPFGEICQPVVVAEISRLVNVLEFRIAVFKSLRGNAEILVSVKIQQVGALPHIAEIRRADCAVVLPAFKVAGGIEQHAALVVERPRAEYHAPHAILKPHLGVADVAGAELGIIDVPEDGFLGAHGHSIGRCDVDNIRVPAAGDVVVVAVLLDVACVENMHDIAAHHRASGINSVPVVRSIGEKHRACEFPFQHIWASVMSPALLSAAVCVIGGVLKIHVIVPAEPAQPVGVVEPALRRFKVKPLPPFSVYICHEYHPFASSRSTPPALMFPSAMRFTSA